MPVIDADGCPIHVEVEGPERAPVLMLSNSLGTTLHMWDGQVEPFTQHFRLVRYDRRGHGKSGVPEGPLHHGAARPRRAGGPRRARDQEGQLVRPLDGRHGRAVARRQCAGARSSGSCCPTRRATSPTRTAGTTASELVREKGVPAFAARQHGALVHQGLPRARAGRRSRRCRDVRGHAARRLYRLRRGGARHGPPRAAAEDQGADPGHRRPPRSRHTSGSRRIHRTATFPAPSIAVLDAAHISNIEQPQQFNDAVLGFLTRR